MLIPRRRGRGSRAEMRVASRLRKAGFKVRRNKRSKVGEIDIDAKKGKNRYFIEVKSGKSPIASSDIRKLVRKARYHKAKPVLYKSKQRKLTKPARELVKRLGVRVRNI